MREKRWLLLLALYGKFLEDDSSFLNDHVSPILSGACQRDFYSISTISWNPVCAAPQKKESPPVHLAIPPPNVVSLVFLDFSRPQWNAEEAVDDLLQPRILSRARRSILTVTPCAIQNNDYLPRRADELSWWIIQRS